MKAAVLVNDKDPLKAFELQELPNPVPKPTEVLIRVSHSGINYADVMARKGMYNDRPKLPCILGYEAVGEILELGTEVKGYEVGDRVLAFTHFGGYADHCVSDVRGLIKLGDTIPGPEATALATQYCTAWYAACMLINLNEGDRVLIHAAAGGVGIALIQIAKAKGCIVYGVAGGSDKMNFLRSIGVDYPIDHRQAPFDEQLQRLLGKERLDVAFDPVGGSNFKKSNLLLGSGGRMVTFGASSWSASKGRFIDKLKLAFGFGFFHPIGLLMKSKSIIGVNMLRIGENRPSYLEQAKKRVFEAYDSGLLKPQIDEVFDAKDVLAAHQKMEARKTIGKVVLKW